MSRREKRAWRKSINPLPTPKHKLRSWAKERSEFETPAEEKFRLFVERFGFAAQHYGWPDYLIYSKDYRHYAFVEVKRSRKDVWSKNQVDMYALLEKLGLPVFTFHSDEDEWADLEKWLAKRFFKGESA